MNRALFTLAFMVVALPTGSAGDDLSPGQTPTDPRQVARINAARESLSAALRRADPAAIASAEAEVRAALGPFVGVPEAAEASSYKGKRAPRPSLADYRKLTERMGTLGSGSERAKENRMELRHVAYLAIGLLAMSESGLPDAAAFRKQAAVELDYLILKQAIEGYFPYPANPVAPPHLHKLAARVAKARPDKVNNGYIYVETDGAKFDTGCAAYALAYGYEVLKEERFLDAARKAGEWALRSPLSANWNYNSFSVWQLAKLAEITEGPRYRDEAVRIAKLGVLPGQMDSGRWSDQHNARAVYHWIIVRGLVALLRVLPPDGLDGREIRAKTRLAVQCRVEDVLGDGDGNSVHAYVALAEALDYFGPNERWEEALVQLGGISPYAAGVYARRQAGLK